MWKHLERHRHRYSLILFGSGLVWLALGFLPGTDTADHLRHLAAFIAIMGVTAFYYVSGVPGLAEGAAYVGIAATCALVALLPHILPERLLALPQDFAYATAGILFILMALLLRLPRHARAWAARRMFPDNAAARRHARQLAQAEELQANPAEQPAGESGAGNMPDLAPEIPAADTAVSADAAVAGGLPRPGVPYPACQPRAASRAEAGSAFPPFRQASQYTQAVLDSLRSWSLANALPGMRWFRATAAVALALAGVIALALAYAQDQPAANFFRSSRFSLLFIGAAALCYAAGVIALGFLRGLALPGFAVLTFYSVLGVVRIEGLLRNRAFALRFGVAILFLALYSLLVFYLLKGFRRRHDLFNWVYQKGSRIIGVDIALKDLLPIAGFSERIDTVISLEPTLAMERLQQRAIDVAVWYQHRLSVRQLLPVGYVFEPGARRLMLHAYCRPDRAEDGVAFISRVLTLQGLTAAVQHESDPDWQTYRERLFPDEVTLHEIVNVQQLDRLEVEGVDLQAIHPIRIELRFPTCEARMAAQAGLAEAGFATVTDESLDRREREAFESEPNDCLAFVELNIRLELERINAITSTLICLVEPFAGDLFGWELIAPKDADPFAPD